MDREMVITHLQIIHTWAEFARERDLQFFTAKHLEDIAKWSDDAIELLKEQKAQKFFVDESGKITPLPVVVRCKDCKKHRKEDCKAEHHDFYPDGEVYSFIPNDDWFCADGVKCDA